MSIAAKIFFPFIILILTLNFASNSLLWAQSSLDEVHVLPRAIPAATGPDTGIDPKLDTHAEAIKKVVDLVLVSVTITDPMGRLVVGLSKENFQVFDGKQPQEIRHFSNEDGPISLGIIFDMSGSMKDKLDRAREAVVEFCKTANPQDEFFMITFSDTPQLAVNFTSNIEDVQNSLASSVAKGRTALLDSIYLGLAKMREAKNQKKALLIISDGGDNRSRYTQDEIKSMVKEANVMVYSIGLFDRNFHTPEELQGPELLQQITTLAGGRAFTLENPNDLPGVAESIATELRNQYLLAYRPQAAPHDGKWHKIRIRMRVPHGWPFLSITAKTGYYAPAK